MKKKTATLVIPEALREYDEAAIRAFCARDGLTSADLASPRWQAIVKNTICKKPEPTKEGYCIACKRMEAITRTYADSWGRPAWVRFQCGRIIVPRE